MGRKHSKDEAEKTAETTLFKRNPRNREEESNQLVLDEFHKPIHKPKDNKAKRKQTDKKRLRDLERMVAREGMPQEIKQAKIQEMKDIKKLIKSKKEAVKFETKYKKIKFVEKRKVIRMLEQI